MPAHQSHRFPIPSSFPHPHDFSPVESRQRSVLQTWGKSAWPNHNSLLATWFWAGMLARKQVICQKITKYSFKAMDAQGCNRGPRYVRSCLPILVMRIQGNSTIELDKHVRHLFLSTVIYLSPATQLRSKQHCADISQLTLNAGNTMLCDLQVITSVSTGWLHALNNGEHDSHAPPGLK